MLHTSSRRKAVRFRLLVGLANLVLFYLLYRWMANNIDLGRLKQSLWEIPAWAVLLSVALHISILCLYGLRMRLLLRRGFIESFAVVNIGYALNTVIPLRLGDVMKIWLGHRLYGLSITGVVAASAVEKLFDLFMLLLLGGVLLALATSKFLPSGLLPSLALFLAVAVSGLLFLRSKVVAIIRLIPKKGRLRRIAVSLYRHADDYPLAWVLLISFAIWAMNVLLIYASFNTFIAGTHIDAADTITLLLIISLTVATPSAPAGVGLFEAGLVAYLTQVLHADAEVALAAAIMLHMVITLPQALVTVVLVLITRRKHGQHEQVA